ncbi:MAG: hypothetical protein IKE21_02960 [Erysipelotrichaceae bacterium]|nr:hypothetical protein [Erysipelotrichaceae bacterium]
MKRLREYLKKDPGLFWNILYALFHLVLSFYYRSYWYLSLGAWYLLLGILKLYVLLQKDVRKQQKICGIGILGMAVILAGIVAVGIRERQNPVRGLITMIALAAFTFTLLTVAVVRVIKARRSRSEEIFVRRDIALVSAVGSLLSLERGMLGSFGDPCGSFTLQMEAGTGAGAFLLIVIIGIFTLKRRYDPTDPVQ